MTQLPAEHAAIDRRIVDELFDAVPEEWTAFRLTIEPGTEGKVRLSLVNPDVAGADAEPGEALRASVVELAAFFARTERKWERLSYSGHLGADGEWRLKIVAPLQD